mgnify:CR=1 FL=1
MLFRSVIDAVDASPRARNTIIVFTADSGVARGSHGLIGKQNLYEHSVRVPLIVAGPGIPAGRRTAAMCYLFDLLPTLGAALAPLLPQAAASRVASLLLACLPPRPCPEARLRAPRCCSPSTGQVTEIEWAWIPVRPSVPPPHPVPASMSVGRRRARGFPPGQSPSPLVGAVPRPTLGFRLLPWMPQLELGRCFSELVPLRSPDSDPSSSEQRSCAAEEMFGPARDSACVLSICQSQEQSLNFGSQSLILRH